MMVVMIMMIDWLIDCCTQVHITRLDNHFWSGTGWGYLEIIAHRTPYDNISIMAAEIVGVIHLTNS
jgi:hypothetical protein